MGGSEYAQQELIQEYQMSGKHSGSIPAVLPPWLLQLSLQKMRKKREICACNVHDKHCWKKIAAGFPHLEPISQQIHFHTFVMAAFVRDDLHFHHIKSVQSGKAMG